MHSGAPKCCTSELEYINKWYKLKKEDVRFVETITEIQVKELKQWCHKLKDPHEKSIHVSIKILVASDNIQILHF
jgi:hypothetical protein